MSLVTMVPESYIPPQEFQMPGTIYCETKDGTRMTLAQAKASKTPVKKLILQPTGGLLYNTTYTICAEPGIKSLTGKTLKERTMVNFTGSYGPLYSTPLEVHGVIKALYEHFTLHEVYTALRDAGQKAHILLKYYPDINSTRFRPVLEVRLEYFPMTKVIIFQAALTLLTSLYMKLGERFGVGGDTGIFSNESSIKLGDFTATEKTDPKILSEGLMSIVNGMMKQVQNDLHYWEENLLGRTKRGYAKPIAAAMRSKNGATPDDRSI